jgi:hypothetical protein
MRFLEVETKLALLEAANTHPSNRSSACTSTYQQLLWLRRDTDSALHLQNNLCNEVSTLAALAQPLRVYLYRVALLKWSGAVHSQSVNSAVMKLPSFGETRGLHGTHSM